MMGYGNWDRGRNVPPFAPGKNVALGLAVAAFVVPSGLLVAAAPVLAWRKTLGLSRKHMPQSERGEA